MDGFVTLARRMRDRDDVGFVFVGRGSEAARLKDAAKGQPNLLVLDEIEPSVLPALLARCHVGIVALHPAHGTHNIPGKLLTYLHAVSYTHLDVYKRQDGRYCRQCPVPYRNTLKPFWKKATC